jgi:outer membrane protein
MLNRAVALALLIPMMLQGQGVATGDARPISLAEAVRLAQQNSPSTVQARGQVRTSDAAIRSAYGAFMPSLNASLGSNRQGGSTFFQGELVPFRGDPWNFSRGLNSSLELFDGGRRLYELRSARATQDAAESNERLQMYNVEFNVKQQYFNILAARESRLAAEAQLAQAEAQFNAASARVAAGAATKSDSLRAVIEVGNARLAILTAENNIRVASASLTRLVGTPFQVTAAMGDTLGAPPAAIDSVELAQWIQDAPPTRQAQSDLTAARAARKAAKTPYLPTLTVGFNYSGSRTAETFAPTGGPFSTSYATRFTVSYPIFNGFQREENVARANVAEDNAEAVLRDARLAVQQQLTQYLGALRLAESRVSIQQASVAAAEEDVRVQSQRYSLGSSTQLELLTSQSTLNQARYALIQARYEARTARAQIEALIGRPIP